MADTTLSFNVLAKDNASRTITRVGQKFGGLNASVGKVTKGMGFLGPAIAGLGAAAAGKALVDMAKGAAEDEAAQKTLAVQLKNSAKATDAQVSAVEDYISKTGVATGVTDDEMRPALANLVRATKDVDKAQGLMNLAMDVSKGTGKDLGAVTMALAKAQNGNVGALGKLGLATKDANGKTKSFAQIQKDLAATFKGQASAQADTMAGKMARLKLIFAETQETIGAKLIPIATKLADWFLKSGIPAISAFAGWVDRNKKALLILGAVAGGFAVTLGVISLTMTAVTGAMKIWGAVTKAAAAAQWLLNIALTANPIGLVIVGIAALAAGLVIAYKKSETFRRIVDGAFKAVKTVVLGAVTAVVDFFQNNWKRLPLLLLGPIGIILFLFKGLPGKIVKAVGNVAGTLAGKGKDLIWGLASGVYKNVTGLMKWWAGLPGSILRWIGNVGASLTRKGKDLIWGLAGGVYANVTGLVRWWAGLPASVIRWIGDTSRTLYSKGGGFLQGLWAGLMNKWISVTKWISGLKASVLAWIGDSSKWLVQKGRDVLWGFLGGLKAVWSEVTKWVSGIATWIKDHKGPVSLDGRLLIPAGQAIMSGFLKGLKSGAGPAWDFVKGVGGKSVEMLRSVFGGNEFTVPGDVGVLTGPNRRVFYQGEALDLSTYRKIKQAEARLGEALNITQGSYERRSSFSGSTHTGGGVFDVVGGNLTRINSILRGLGFASWVRQPWQGPWPAHVHAIERGNTRASDSAKAQVADFMRGGDGLAGYKQGTPWVPNDQLAFLHKGEAVLSPEMNAARIRGGGDGGQFLGTVRFELALDGKTIQTKLLKLKRTNGGLALGLA